MTRALSSSSRAAYRLMCDSGVVGEKRLSRASWGVLTPHNDLPVMVILVVFHGCRFIARSQLPAIPRGGVDAINTPAGAFRDSKYFCTTKPPMECPITTGLAGSLSATESTSAT